jgi:N-acetylglucosaminyl-diphospho-decaprenol L-rhamnosyltransferase
MIAVSIVSHGHGSMVQRLVAQLLTCSEVGQVIITYNIPEAAAPFSDSRIKVISNISPKGFGANHNAAFTQTREEFWCVLNPDITLVGNPFPVLLATLKADSVGLVAPLILNPAGGVEDSVRYFPTLRSLALKLLGTDSSRYKINFRDPVFYPQWVAGMFMLFKAAEFAKLRGFDKSYFLYYEDVDICWRTWHSGLKVAVCPLVSAIHEAQRASRRNMRHLRWHLASMRRFLWKSR